MALKRCSGRAARHRTGYERVSRYVLWAGGLSFLLVFAAFEILHPLADILHAQAHIDCREHGTPQHSSHSGEASVSEAHGPYVLTWDRPKPYFDCRKLPVYGGLGLPEPPFLDPPSPVPISA